MDHPTPTLPTIDLPRLGSRRRLTDVVCDALRDAITDGVLTPGARLREVALATQFDVSPTPVREAIRRLEREGLVEVSPHRGAVVATLSARGLADLYEVHEVLQCHAVRRAAELDHDDFSRLEELLTAAAPVLTRADQIEFNRLDLAFHRALNEMSGNSPLADFIEQVHRRIQTARIRCAVHLPDRPARSHAQHEQILRAIRNRDADRAEALTRAHIRTVRDAVQTVLDEIDQQAPSTVPSSAR
ncbi:MAG: GntR family transcriptional regulator [Thermomicrobiales bacterium]